MATPHGSASVVEVSDASVNQALITMNSPQSSDQETDRPGAPRGAQNGESEARGNRVSSWVQDQLAEVAGSPPNTFWARTIGGWVGPLVLALLAIRYVLGHPVAVFTKGNPATPAAVVTGSGAVGFGVALLCLGLLTHFHFFWAYRAPAVAALGKLIAFVGATGAAAVFFWHLIVH